MKADANQITEAGCKCNLRTRLVGDGCEVCNPAKALEYAKQTIADLERELRLAVGARDYANDMLDKARITATAGDDLLDAAADMLGDSYSGFIQGSSSDMKWRNDRNVLIERLRAKGKAK